MHKVFALLSALALCFGVVSTGLARSGVEMVGENAKIDWTNHFYVATGEGAMPTPKEEPNRARAFLKAKTYARSAAVANLLMAAKGTFVDYESNGKDFMADEVVRQRIKGIAKAVQVIETRKEQLEGGTIVVVRVRAPMPAERPLKTSVQVAMAPVTADWHSPLPGHNAYTSLIVDARGCGLERCMSPKIRTRDGKEVWGTVKVDYDFLQDHGIVAYARSMTEARNNERCGNRPLVMKAIGRAGGSFHSDPVVSDRDADLIRRENAEHGFLDDFRVIFIKE